MKTEHIDTSNRDIEIEKKTVRDVITCPRLTSLGVAWVRTMPSKLVHEIRRSPVEQSGQRSMLTSPDEGRTTGRDKYGMTGSSAET